MKIKSSNDLRLVLGEMITKVMDGEVTSQQANSVGGLVDKYIKTVKLDMDYYKLKDRNPDVRIASQEETIKLEEQQAEQLNENNE